MRWIQFASCFILLFVIKSVFALAPTTISGPIPAIPSLFNVGSSSTYVYTITNNVPDHAFPVSVTGLSGAVTRVTVPNDCGNTLPAAPSTCHVGILISPTSVSAAINQTISINYQGRTPLTNDITFSVPAFVAGGVYQNGFFNSLPLFLRSVNDGNSWNAPALSAITLPSNFVATEVDAANCFNGICIEVGVYRSSTAGSLPFMMRSTDLGGSWASQFVPLPSDFLTNNPTALTNIQCVGSLCVSAGFYSKSNLTQGLFLLVSRNQGNSWAFPSSIILPANLNGGVFSASLFCNTSFCLVGGSYNISQFNLAPLLIVSNNNGSTWAPAAITLPTDYSSNGSINTAMCHAHLNLCISAGTYATTVVQGKPLLLVSHDGNNWSSPVQTLPGDFNFGSLQVSACNDHVCVVGGAYADNSSFIKPLLLVTNNNGNNWGTPSVTLPPDFGNAGFINAITCTVNNCIIVGSYNTLSNDLRPLILTSNLSGSAWTFAAVTLPLDFLKNGGLSSVTCINTTCAAVGRYTNTFNNVAPLLLISKDTGNSWIPAPTIFPSDYAGIGELDVVVNTAV